MNQKKLLALLTELRSFSDGDGKKIAGKSGYTLQNHRWHANDLQGGAHLDHLRSTYQEKHNIPHTPLTQIGKLDKDFSAKIGKAYDDMPLWDAKALPAYDALMKETKQQHDHLVDAGYKYTLHYGAHEPYASSDAMREDLHNNKHMHVFATASGFGDEPFAHHYDMDNNALVDQPNPLLKHVQGMSSMEKPVLYNDLFRFVHDAFGHGIHPHQFGQLGEDNAYREHMTMFTPEAQRALTTETRGQNSWVNSGPHLRRPDGSFPKKGDPDFTPTPERRFADQKIALLPEWAMDLNKGTPKKDDKKSYADDVVKPDTDPYDEEAEYGELRNHIGPNKGNGKRDKNGDKKN